MRAPPPPEPFHVNYSFGSVRTGISGPGTLPVFLKATHRVGRNAGIEAFIFAPDYVKIVHSSSPVFHKSQLTSIKAFFLV